MGSLNGPSCFWTRYVIALQFHGLRVCPHFEVQLAIRVYAWQYRASYGFVFVNVFVCGRNAQGSRMRDAPTNDNANHIHSGWLKRMSATLRLHCNWVIPILQSQTNRTFCCSLCNVRIEWVTVWDSGNYRSMWCVAPDPPFSNSFFIFIIYWSYSSIAWNRFTSMNKYVKWFYV